MITRRCPASKTSGFLICLAVAAALVLPVAASASQIYYYRDSRGGWHFTDAPTDTRFRPFKVKAGVGVGGQSVRLDPRLVQPYVLAAATEFSLDPDLIKAVIKAESAFDPYAVSWAGAQGLMQLMPGTASLMGVTNAFSPRQNIHGGSRYLRCMLDRFKGDVKLALAAYNIGPEKVAQVNGIPDVRETRMYVQRVLQYHNEFKKKKK